MIYDYEIKFSKTLPVGVSSVCVYVVLRVEPTAFALSYTPSPIYLSTYMSVCLFICLSIYPSIIYVFSLFLRQGLCTLPRLGSDSRALGFRGAPWDWLICGSSQGLNWRSKSERIPFAAAGGLGTIVPPGHFTLYFGFIFRGQGARHVSVSSGIRIFWVKSTTFGFCF